MIRFSNFGLYMLLFLMLISASCAWFKKAPKDEKVYDEKEELEEISGKKVFNPETGRYEIVRSVTEPMDTVRWQDLSEQEFPPIRYTGTPVTDNPVTPSSAETPPVTNPATVLKTRYDVSLLLPFLGQNFDTVQAINENSLWAINFYGGAKIAFDKLQGEGINLNVQVFDSKASDSDVDNLLKNQPVISRSDLVIGPYRRDNVAQVAEFAKKNKITYVSPYSASSGLSKMNPEYIQVNPSLEAHCQAITKFVRAKFPAEQVVLVSKDNESEKARFEYFHKANAAIDGNSKGKKFTELVISSDLTNLTEERIKPFILPLKTTVFILPSWSDETFVGNFLRLLDIAKMDNSVMVMGMPQWMDYQKIDYDYYEKLNVHVSSAGYIDNNSLEVRNFKKNFFERYAAAPREEALLGYDVMLYFGRMLKKYGTKFQPQMELEKANGLHMKFAMEPLMAPNPAGAEKPGVVEQYENKAVFILQFQNYYFQPAN